MHHFFLITYCTALLARVAASISPLSKITGYSILLMGKITKNNNVCSTDAVARSNLDERCDKMTNKISPV